MSGPIDARPIRPNEIEEARKLVPEGAAEPNWNDVFVVTKGEEIIGLMGADVRLVAEPFYMKPGHAGAAIMAIGWIDGTLRQIAGKLGLRGYQMFIGDEHPAYQKFIRSNLPVSEGREKPGLFFFRTFL